MGRAHLSAQYGIDGAHSRMSSRRPSPVPQLPKFLEAPFDLDAEVASGPDVVYEAFLTTEELRRREDAPVIRVGSRRSEDGVDGRTASPVESIDTESTATTSTGTEPNTRVHTPVPSNTMGIRVLQLVEPLTAARDAVFPDLQEAVSTSAAIGPLAISLVTTLRPHITSAIAPFLSHMPDAECLAHMFERSVIFDVLGTSTDRSAVGGYPLHTVIEALDAADERLRVSAAAAENTASDGLALEDDDEDDLVSDPGMDEEDMAAEAGYRRDIASPASPNAIAGNLNASLNRWWNDQDPASLDWARRLSPSPSPSPPPVIPSARAAAPAARLVNSAAFSAPMDVDTDTDTESSSNTSSSGRSGSVYRASLSRAAFHPRIVSSTQRFPVLSTGSAHLHLYHDHYEQDRFVPIERLRAPSPLR